MDYQKAMQVKTLLREAYIVRPRNLISSFSVESEQVNKMVADHRTIVGVGPVKRSEDDYAIRLFTQQAEPFFNRAELAEQLGVSPQDIELIITEGIYALNSPIQSHVRPAPLGSSIGPHGRGTGTLGALVRDGANRLYILSNNHVLADGNRVNIGGNILQPGQLDQGTFPVDVVARLSRFFPLDFAGENEVDAAIAQVINPADMFNSLPNSIPSIGVLQGCTDPVNGMIVAKYGRTTGLTIGTIKSLTFPVQVNIIGRPVNFDNQLHIEGNDNAFVGEGDSGSVVIDLDSKKVVGLLFAGDRTNPRHAFANPISTVLRLLDVMLV